MKKKMKSVTRKLSGIFLAIMMMVASSMSVFAATTDETDVANAENVSATAETRAGNETWTGSGFGGAYTFTDYNLTPVKTMGESGTLLIHGSFYGNDGYANVSPIKLTAQIRNTAGGVKAQTVVVDDRSGYVSFSVSCITIFPSIISLKYCVNSPFSFLKYTPYLFPLIILPYK